MDKIHTLALRTFVTSPTVLVQVLFSTVSLINQSGSTIPACICLCPGVQYDLTPLKSKKLAPFKTILTLSGFLTGNHCLYYFSLIQSVSLDPFRFIVSGKPFFMPRAILCMSTTPQQCCGSETFWYGSGSADPCL
jgi:hypothetical protein